MQRFWTKGKAIDMRIDLGYNYQNSSFSKILHLNQILCITDMAWPAGRYVLCKGLQILTTPIVLIGQSVQKPDVIRFFLSLCSVFLTFWSRNYFFLILAHPVYKM